MNDTSNECTDCDPESTEQCCSPKEEDAPSAASDPENAIWQSITTMLRELSEDSSATTATPQSASSNSMSPPPIEPSPIWQTLPKDCALMWWNPAHHHSRLCSSPNVYGMPYPDWTRYGQ